MANKTIYFKDDALWERAKQLADKDGISAVIQDALAGFVERKKLEVQGFRPFRLEVGLLFDEADATTVGTTERISFVGLPLVRGTCGYTVTAYPDAKPEADLMVYRTKGGKLILTVDETGGYHHGISHYGVYSSLRELAQDAWLKRADPVGRAQFLDDVARQLGEDWAVWID